MPSQSFSLDSFTTFGDLLKYLRRRERLTQLELSITVGYSEAQIGRLEKNQRLPDITALKALFIPALHLEDIPELLARFLELAQSARQQDAPAPGIAPYKGLLFFDESDTDLFFGREALTARLADRAADLATDSSLRFLAVVGASGSGKSSLVRAGLAATLQRTGWNVRVFTPTENPLKALEAQLNSKQVELKSERSLILVDQFEETFTLCRDEAERIAFIEKLLLLAALTPASPPLMGEEKVVVVIALRADFYSHCAQHPLLRSAVATEQEYIGQMTTDELRRAIEEPAKRGSWEFEHGLVDMLLTDIGADGKGQPEPGALPLLSHALLATWERRRGRTFTLDGYRASGGVRGAVAETAESVFADQLNQKQQELARDVFLRLTELGVGTEDTRRRAALNELVRQSSEAAQLRAVLNVLAEARLITLNEDSAEVAHEALIREWQRLHEWLTQDREGLQLHRHLTESAQEWEARERDASELYRGARLAQAREWTMGNEERLNESERAFLKASVDQEQYDAVERDAQRQRELDAAQNLAETQSRAAKQLRRRAAYLSGAFVLVIILAGVALLLGKQTESEKQIATSRELASASVSNLNVDPERSILLALQAEKLADTWDAENALHRAILMSRVQLVFRGHTAEVWSVAYSPDGTRIATASQDNTAKVWDATSGQLLLTLTGHTDHVNGVVFSPGGKLIATTSDDDTAKIWDAMTGKELFTLTGDTNFVKRAAFSPDGKHLATSSRDGTARIWDVNTGRQLQLLQYNVPLPDVAFSPDGTRLATTTNTSGSDTVASVLIWDLSTGKIVQTFSAGEPTVLTGVAFSPDGSRVAASSLDAYGIVWDVNTGREFSRFTGHNNQVDDIAFSPDGKWIATSSQDHTAKIWDPTTGKELLSLAGHTNGVNGVSFSPDGKHLATASLDGTARIWNLTPPSELLYIPTNSHGQLSLSADGTYIVGTDATGALKKWDSISGKELMTFDSPLGPEVIPASSPNGKLVAGVSGNGPIIIWDANTGKQLLTLPGHSNFVDWIIFSPGGKQLASSSDDNTAIIWDLIRGKALFTLKGGGAADNGIPSVAFSPDGTRVVTGDYYGDGIIWDAAHGIKLLTLSGHSDTIWDIAYSADGTRIATASRDGTAKIWDAFTGKDVLTLIGHAGTVVSVAFSSDGKMIATGSKDGTAKIWDALSGMNLLTFPLGRDGTGNVSFSPDGKRLVVQGETGDVYVFALSIKDVIALAKSRITRSLTTEECRQYLHLNTCPSGQ